MLFLPVLGLHIDHLNGICKFVRNYFIDNNIDDHCQGIYDYSRRQRLSSSQFFSKASFHFMKKSFLVNIQHLSFRFFNNSISTYFASLRQNSEFQQTHWQKIPLVFEHKISETAFSMSDLKEAVDTDFLEAGRGENNRIFRWHNRGCYLYTNCFACRNVSRWEKWLEYGGCISSTGQIFPRC